MDWQYRRTLSAEHLLYIVVMEMRLLPTARASSRSIEPLNSSMPPVYPSPIMGDVPSLLDTNTCRIRYAITRISQQTSKQSATRQDSSN